MDTPTITVMMPTFDRPASWPKPSAPPTSLDEWATLPLKSREELIDLGFASWDGSLFLVPLEWYEHLPNGLSLESISGKFVVVSDGYRDINSQDYIDNDTRFGMLAYGIRRVETSTESA